MCNTNLLLVHTLVLAFSNGMPTQRKTKSYLEATHGDLEMFAYGKVVGLEI